MNICNVNLTLQPTKNSSSGFKTNLSLSVAKIPTTNLLSAKTAQLQYNTKHKHYFVTKNASGEYVFGVRRVFICRDGQSIARAMLRTLNELVKEFEKLILEKDTLTQWVDIQEGGYNMCSRMFLHDLHLLAQSPSTYENILRDQYEQQLAILRLYPRTHSFKTITDYYTEYLTESIREKREI